MKTGLRFMILLAGILLTLGSGVSHAVPDDKVIKVYAARTFAEQIQALGKQFMKEHPDVRVEVLGKSTESGFEVLLTKGADLVVATREPNAVERRLAEQKGIHWTGESVASEDVAVICHPGASVRELTVEQLRKIYTGEYTNWRDVGGANVPILPHSMAYPQDDIANWFLETVLSKAEFASGIIWINAPDFLVQHVSVHEGSVAYLGDLQLTGALKRRPRWKVEVLRIRENPESPAFSPSEAILNKGHYPLTIPLFLFRNENGANEMVEPFARFCREKLQEPVAR